MKWRVLLETTDTDGVVVTHEVSSGSRPVSRTSANIIGLTLGEGKSTLACLQQHLVRFQAEEFCRERRLSKDVAPRRPIKDRRFRLLTTLFGVGKIRVKYGHKLPRAQNALRPARFSFSDDRARQLTHLK